MRAELRYHQHSPWCHGMQAWVDHTPRYEDWHMRVWRHNQITGVGVPSAYWLLIDRCATRLA